jgi:hypothetical protein
MYEIFYVSEFLNYKLKASTHQSDRGGSGGRDGVGGRGGDKSLLTPTARWKRSV